MNRAWSLAALTAAVVIALAACSSGGPGSSGGANATVIGAAPTPPPTIAPSLPTQTDTSWGRIWDDVPDSFPDPTGSEPATDTGQGPASAQLVVTAAASDVADGYVTALHSAGWTVTRDGPLADGSIVVNATNAGDCKARITVHSIGDASTVVVLYGATCPFE
ncbi:MAG TPA: hypothetical protein VE011_00995 [Candidatus Dormibacteraeota bacterium]|nr:hypothetical protein [Candidatus Dormibacteraeota bacterium]